jgi:hypothetical protein
MKWIYAYLSIGITVGLTMLITTAKTAKIIIVDDIFAFVFRVIVWPIVLFLNYHTIQYKVLWKSKEKKMEELLFNKDKK